MSITNTPMLMTNHIMNPSMQYTIEDLTPLVNVVTDPGVMVVAKDSKYKTMKEMLDAARAAPGRVTVGNSGVGGDDFFSVIIAGAAVDVFDDEPNIDPRWFTLDNVVLSPHIGSATNETRSKMLRLTLDNLHRHFAGEPVLTSLPAPNR